ncbi:MAG TPA: single-stranded DNA-binding protein [Trebonia sp.]|jgi:single-strand DNA-binding protein|nr:single-stranded DNA-binding protein [Trebonia sp.]
MSQANYIMMTGFVTREPEFSKTRNDIAVARIRVGSATRYPDRTTGEWVDGDVSYFDVTCWRRLAVNVKACLRKGDMITIQGKFRTRSWLVAGEDRPRTRMEIIADSVGHDLSYGWTAFNRGSQPPTRVAAELEKGEPERAEAGSAADGHPEDGHPEDGYAEDGYAGDYADLPDQPGDGNQTADGVTPVSEGEAAGTEAATAADERQLAEASL